MASRTSRLGLDDTCFSCYHGADDGPRHQKPFRRRRAHYDDDAYGMPDEALKHERRSRRQRTETFEARLCAKSSGARHDVKGEAPHYTDLPRRRRFLAESAQFCHFSFTMERQFARCCSIVIFSAKVRAKTRMLPLRFRRRRHDYVPSGGRAIFDDMIALYAANRPLAASHGLGIRWPCAIENRRRGDDAPRAYAHGHTRASAAR